MHIFHQSCVNYGMQSCCFFPSFFKYREMAEHKGTTESEVATHLNYLVRLNLNYFHLVQKVTAWNKTTSLEHKTGYSSELCLVMYYKSRVVEQEKNWR